MRHSQVKALLAHSSATASMAHMANGLTMTLPMKQLPIPGLQADPSWALCAETMRGGCWQSPSPSRRPRSSISGPSNTETLVVDLAKSSARLIPSSTAQRGHSGIRCCAAACTTWRLPRAHLPPHATEFPLCSTGCPSVPPVRTAPSSARRARAAAAVRLRRRA